MIFKFEPAIPLIIEIFNIHIIKKSIFVRDYKLQLLTPNCLVCGNGENN